MRDVGLVNSDEPFKRLLCQGMVLAETYYRDEDNGGKQWISPQEVEAEHDEKGKVTGYKSTVDGEEVLHAGTGKMSKSKNNGIDPQMIIDKYGADTVRLFMMFAAPPEQSLEWSDSAVEGAHRFLKRLWKAVHSHHALGEVQPLEVDKLNEGQKALRRKTHETISKVSDDISRRLTFNTSIAAVMELMNLVNKYNDTSDQGRAVLHEALEAATLLLSPIVPHISHTLWEILGHEDIVLDAPWPTVDESALTKDSIQIVAQINGKVRAKIDMPADADKATIEKAAMNDANVQRFLEDKTIRKVIVVPGKLVNIVAN